MTSEARATGIGGGRPQAGGTRPIVSAAGLPPWELAPPETQPNRGVVRLNGVIANLIHRPDRPVALDLLLRLAAVALVTVAILGLLPAIAEVAA
jgi:hypothetical protein